MHRVGSWVNSHTPGYELRKQKRHDKEQKHVEEQKKRNAAAKVEQEKHIKRAKEIYDIKQALGTLPIHVSSRDMGENPQLGEPYKDGSESFHPRYNVGIYHDPQSLALQQQTQRELQDYHNSQKLRANLNIIEQHHNE